MVAGNKNYGLIVNIFNMISPMVFKIEFRLKKDLLEERALGAKVKKDIFADQGTTWFVVEADRIYIAQGLRSRGWRYVPDSLYWEMARIPCPRMRS